MPPRPPSPALLGPLLALLALLPGCRMAYVGRAALHQAELLAKREPIDRVLARGDLDEERAAKLASIPSIRAYGEELGLRPSRSYGSYAARWDRTIYNMSACEPLSLEPVGWRFPVVGQVPYLGFFRAQDLARWESRYREQGYDVYVREVAAYSTLGWFRDPVLPAMLRWEEYWLAEVVLHELAHATLWIPGSVSFNETFANVVGEQAATRWMIHRYGAESPQVHDMWIRREDQGRWRALLEDLYSSLDVVYKNGDTTPEEKREAKTALFAGLDAKVVTAGFHRPEPYVREAREGEWNNARVAQYRTYNHDRGALERLLAAHDGDLRAFVADIEKITSKGLDPWDAVQDAAPASAPVQK